MSTATPSAKKKKKSKKEKKEKKKKSSSGSSKKRQREDSPDAGGKTVKKSNTKRRKSNEADNGTIYSRLKDDENNELWLLRVPKTLNLQELDGQEIDVKDDGTLYAELTYSSSQQSENLDSDDAVSDSEGKLDSTKRQYIAKFALENRCSQVVCFLSHGDEGTLSEGTVKPMRFKKQVNFTETIVGLPSVHTDKQRLSGAYKGVPQKKKLQYNLRTIGYVDPADVCTGSSVNADSKPEENRSSTRKNEKKEEKKKKEKKEKKDKKKKKKKKSSK